MTAVLATLALLAGQPNSAPSVFVETESNLSWFISKAKARPMGKALDTVTLSALNAYREQNWPAFQPFCYLDPLGRSSFAGVDRKAAQEIEATFKSVGHDPFRQSFSTSDGRSFNARVGLAEECETGTIVSTIVVYDAKTNAIENVLEWSETPFRFLWPGEGQALTYHSSCFECGDSNALFYDASRRRFYWESQGN